MKTISTESFSKRLLKEKARCFICGSTRSYARYFYVLIKNATYMVAFHNVNVVVYIPPNKDQKRFDDPYYEEIPKEELILKLIVEKLK